MGTVHGYATMDCIYNAHTVTAVCGAEIYKNHSWPNTAPGSTALSPCPCAGVLGVFAGNVSRRCSGSISEGGMWKDELDLSSCEITLSDTSRELCEIALVSDEYICCMTIHTFHFH